MLKCSPWRRNLLICLGSLTAVAGFQACNRKAPDQPAPFEDALLRGRHERDLSFRSSSDSPLPAGQKSQLKGLDYYPPNPALRFKVKLNRYQIPQAVRIGTNTGEIRTGLRYGYFEFEVDGRDCRLQVYRLDDSPAQGAPYLFVPFRDATSGSETYAAGRYIDLRENTTGDYDLDFNRAYNPSCAYRSDFSCPIPPEENRLAVPIRAGERKYPSVGGH
jgi:uncharacterized protein (DUF1684 family)